MSASRTAEESPIAAHHPVVVIGGGAAGVFAALTCAELNSTRRILVLERGPELLSKVRISGGGRCNVTHACFEPDALSQAYPRGQRELIGPFHIWQPRDTMRWFEQRGVALKIEEDGRVFPVSDSSQTIIDCLLRTGRDLRVDFRTRTGLVDAQRRDEGGFTLKLSNGASTSCDQLLIAVGGLKPGPILDLLHRFGHSIAPLAPSLFTFNISDPRLEGLAGVSVEAAEASLSGSGLSQVGPVLVTHWGLSGPAILKLSAWGARWAQEQRYLFDCLINWVPSNSADQVKMEFDQLRTRHATRLVRKTAGFKLPARLWERLVQAAGIAESVSWSQLRREQSLALLDQLRQGKFRVTGKSTFKEEFVTAGGVSLKEINFKRMESRLVPGLFFAGEVLDIDGITGGFNFQAAWTTGVLAGRAMAKEALSSSDGTTEEGRTQSSQ